MGTVFNDAIIVTGQPKDVEAAYLHAVELGLRVTNVVPHAINGKCTFLIVPDGSKLGWDEHLTYCYLRAQWKNWAIAEKSRAFTAPYPKDAVVVQWVHVQYGDDMERPEILDSSDHGEDE